MKDVKDVRDVRDVKDVRDMRDVKDVRNSIRSAHQANELVKTNQYKIPEKAMQPMSYNEYRVNKPVQNRRQSPQIPVMRAATPHTEGATQGRPIYRQYPETSTPAPKT